MNSIKHSIMGLAASIIMAAISLAPVSAQTEAAAAGPYVIRSVDFNVTGRTLGFVLLSKADIKLGTAFGSQEELEAFIADRRQVLANERVLASVEADYHLTAASDGGYDVAILFSTTDSWNVIALPKFQYDSNSGWLFSLRGRDYNFAGSMQTLSLNLNYEIDESKRQGFGVSTSFTLPFQAMGHDWSLGISDSLSLYADGVTPFTSATSATISVTFPEPGFPVTVSAGQSLNFNPDGVTTDPDLYYLGSSASVSASIPTGLDLGILGEISYGPSLSVSDSWDFAGDLLGSGRGGVGLGASHGLSAGRIDWKGNQRSGYSVSLSNSNSFYMPTETFSSYIDAAARAHLSWMGRIGISSRLQAWYRLTGDERTDQGGSLRGILDSRVDGDAAVFANFDMPVKLFDFPTHVFIGKDWLDFELQASPFLDLGLSRRLGSTTGFDDPWYAGGLEFLVFPVKMRSFIVRASLGFDLQAVLENRSLTAPSPRDGASPYEIFFGIGQLY